MPGVIAARLLGPPDLRIDGAPAPNELRWRKHFALCLLLWHAPGRRCTRDHLIGMLWGDRAESAARHSLNEALRVIRRSCGPELIDSGDSGDSGITWLIPPELDTDLFAARERGAPEQAAALVRGAFCEGFAIDDAPEFTAWLDAERTRWHGRMIPVMARAVHSAQERGDVTGATVLAERAVALDRYSDLAAQTLIRALWLGGDRHAALAAGDTFRARLKDDLGLEPDRETSALLRRIARDQGGTGLWEEALAPLVGREDALRTLVAAARGGEHAGGRLLVITGPIGSGRSRLLEELVRRAHQAGDTVAGMRAVPADRDHRGAAALALAAAGLATAPGAPAAPGTALATFARQVPAWAERYPNVASATALPLPDAFVRLALTLAEERPLVLAIDDAERLHPDDLRWFPTLLRAARAHDLTLILTATDGEPSVAIAELVRAAGRELPGVVCTVGAVAAAGLQQLTDWAVPGWSATARERLTRRLHAESGGLPGIAVELLTAVTRGLLLEPGEEWPAPDRTMDTTLPTPMPAPLVAAMRLAFNRLPEDARALLRVAALLEEPFPADVVGHVAEIAPEGRRDAALDTLEREQWLVADPRGYLFPARAKRRLLVNEMMTPGQRRRLTGRIAQATTLTSR